MADKGANNRHVKVGREWNSEQGMEPFISSVHHIHSHGWATTKKYGWAIKSVSSFPSISDKLLGEGHQTLLWDCNPIHAIHSTFVVDQLECLMSNL